MRNEYNILNTILVFGLISLFNYLFIDNRLLILLF